MAGVFYVTLTGGPPWGFRIQGGCDTAEVLHVSRVNGNGKAGHQGVEEGDVIEAVNGQKMDDLSNNEAHQLIKNSGESLNLVLRREGSDPGKMYKSSAVIELNGATPNDMSSWSTASSTSSTGSCSTTIVVSTVKKATPTSDEQTSEDARENIPADRKAYDSDDIARASQPSSSTMYSPSQSRSKKVWSPGKPPPELSKELCQEAKSGSTQQNSCPVWQPFGGLPEEKPQFRSVKLDTQAHYTDASQLPTPKSESKPNNGGGVESYSSSLPSSLCTTSTDETTPSTATSLVSPSFTRISATSRLPPSQSPTITLLQKAREGQIPKGAVYIDHKLSGKGDLIHNEANLLDRQVIHEGDMVHTDSYYGVPIKDITSTTTTIKALPKYEGIGPTEYGIPVSLRTAVKEEYASDWYKTMFRSLHKFEKPDQSDHVAVRYRKGAPPHLGGYMSEPEFEREEDYPYSSRYATLDYRRYPDRSISYSGHARTLPRNNKFDSKSYSVEPTGTTHEIYKNQPRSIAEYEPGHSSIAEKEFQKGNKYYGDRSRTARACIDGYESDSTLIRKTGRTHRLDPQQQKVWYREIQRGGDIPFTGLGKPAPEKPKEPQIGPPPPLPRYRNPGFPSHHNPKTSLYSASPHRYQESEVNIHYRSPIRNLEKEYIDEEELRKRQEDAMRKFYEEERFKKHLQHLAEIEMRRHSDYFIPSQKSPIPLNRYDNPFEPSATPPPKTPEPRTLARAIYSFTAQTARELSLNKSDIVYITKKVDKNWYEGEHHGMIGIFPVSYVEIIPAESANLQPRKATEGVAYVRYNFRAQTPVELSLFKGEQVILVRRVDQNWYEGRIGTKRGIFPTSYIEVKTEPGETGPPAVSPKPPASPVFGPIVNGSQCSCQSQGPTYSTGPSPYPKCPPVPQIMEEKQPITQSLHIDTCNEPIPYRALYSYRPQNDDELELRESDTVYVMEKCDDGWYVGTSLRTGLFGTFPGNYVERI